MFLLDFMFCFRLNVLFLLIDVVCLFKGGCVYAGLFVACALNLSVIVVWLLVCLFNFRIVDCGVALLFGCWVGWGNSVVYFTFISGFCICLLLLLFALYLIVLLDLLGVWFASTCCWFIWSVIVSACRLVVFLYLWLGWLACCLLLADLFLLGVCLRLWISLCNMLRCFVVR